MILVDSSVWIDYFNGRASRETDALDRLLGSDLVLTGDIIVTGVLHGFRKEADFRTARSLLNRLAYQDMLGPEIALRSAKNYRKLRARGVTVRKTLDVMIATFCIRNRHVLLHSDRDFEPMTRFLGLRTLRQGA